MRELLSNGAKMDLPDTFGHICTDDIELLPDVIRLFIEFGYDGRYCACINDDELDTRNGANGKIIPEDTNFDEQKDPENPN